MEKPRLCYLLAAKRILRYIRSASEHGELMPNQQNTRMEAKMFGYCDLYWSGNQDYRKSVTNYLFMLGSAPI